MPPAPTDGSEHEQFLRAVRLCYWRVLNRLDAHLQGDDLTARQFLLLQSLEMHGSANSRALCQRLSMTPANVTGLSDRLERKGFLRRSRDRTDRRQVIFQLTAGGRRALQRAHRTRAAFIGELLSTLSPRDRKALLTSLSTLVARLESDAGWPAKKTGRR